MASRIVDYLDDDNIKRRVLVPQGVESVPPSEGVPLSLDVDRLYADCPLAFRQRLVAELWAQGLIQKDDFLSPSAAERIRAALLATVKSDTVAIINFAKGVTE